jgi:LysM repeat protein
MKRLLIVACIATFALFGLASRPAYAFGETYIVQPGDTLFTIAARYHISAADLAVVNGIDSGMWVYPGQRLAIPDSSPFFEPPSFAGAADPTIDPRFVNFGPPPDRPVFADYSAVLPDMGFYPDADLRAGPSGWEPYAWAEAGPPRPSLSFPAGPPPFYDMGPASPYPPWSGRSNPAFERWIDVDLSRQRLTAYEGQRPVYHSWISSGLLQYPTIDGTFYIYVKYESADMSGGAGDDAYFLPNVPYVMYFHGNYGLHGTYWHHNFGQPMSHGCVNLPTPAAEWLFHWASVGTRVVVHY